MKTLECKISKKTYLIRLFIQANTCTSPEPKFLITKFVILKSQGIFAL